jgi:hypothetical protein|tara:strand:- start:345 stop:488 length:144 start_codon:yes stop_codon:yes gene_type:complete
MDYNYLFDSEFPQGVRSVYLNGKQISKSEFLKIQKEIQKKKRLKVES